MSVEIPEWVFEFHGHKCPFMLIGYRMGLVALDAVGIEKVKDHGAFAFSEMGEGHHNTCLEDGIQASTGCTTGKRLFQSLYYGKAARSETASRTSANWFQSLYYGKAAMIFHAPEKGTVRVALKSDVFDELGKTEFLSYRKKGYTPSDIPEEVKQQVVDYVLGLSDSELFHVIKLKDLSVPMPKKTFAKYKCEECGEYTFEPHIKILSGRKVCIPCAENI